MKINFRINFKKINKIFFHRKYFEYIFILLFICFVGFAGFIIYKYVGIIFQPPTEEKILEIQARQIKIKKAVLEKVLSRIEKRENDLAERLKKEFYNPFSPY